MVYVVLYVVVDRDKLVLLMHLSTAITPPVK